MLFILYLVISCAIDLLGCDYAPNCHSRNRTPCVEPRRTCGPCLEGFSGVEGFANEPCILSESLTIDTEFRIPVLDLESPSVISDFRDASEFGFYLIKNHGVKEELLKEVWEFSESFFNLPLRQKQSAEWGDPVSNVGYTGFGAETLAENGDSDPKEAMDVDEPFILENAFFQNSSMHEYWDAMVTLEARLLKLIALSLGLEEDAFLEFHKEHWATIRLNHYPANPSREEVCGAHNDVGTVTILFQQSSGLEVLDRISRKWVPVKASFDFAVVNFGDSMMKITNNRLVSTMHRVKGTTHKRFSAAYFGHADRDYILDASKFFDDEVQIYRPMKSEDHCVIRRLVVYDMVKDEL